MSEKEIGFPVRESLVAALMEMKVWMYIMYEHAKFIRGELDPSDDQEYLIRKADQFYVSLEELYHQIERTSTHSPLEVLDDLRERTISRVNELIKFKRELYKAVRRCRVLAIMPADEFDHIRREADRFVGTLERSKGKLTRTRRQLGIPDGERMAQTVPRLLYEYLPKDELFAVAIEENMFFTHLQSEHGEQLSLKFRPEVQEKYRQRSLEYKERFEEQLEKARHVEKNGSGLKELMKENRDLTEDFLDFLEELHKKLTNCDIPTHQTNFYPEYPDHFQHEGEYFLDVLKRLSRLL